MVGDDATVRRVLTGMVLGVRLAVPGPFSLLALPDWHGTLASAQTMSSLEIVCGTRPEPVVAALPASRRVARERPTSLFMGSPR